MSEEKKLTEKESLQLIADMIKKAKGSYHDTGVGSLLWGSVVSIASFMTYLQSVYKFSLGFDIWLIVVAAIIPQIWISIREKKQTRAKQYDDDTINAVWLVFGISIFSLSFYQAVIPDATTRLMHDQGFELIKRYTDGTKPDEVLRPFAPSFYSIYLLLYAFPTLVTGLVKKFRPMMLGALLTYILFVISCFTAADQDMLLGGIAAIVCWFIPGIILRRKYLAGRAAADV
ncbi:MAG: hypothetical protein PHD73_09175 [Sediminibacterium sp.]|nr:hypothetical protein [Sediminibacterium sp.]